MAKKQQTVPKLPTTQSVTKKSSINSSSQNNNKLNSTFNSNASKSISQKKTGKTKRIIKKSIKPTLKSTHNQNSVKSTNKPDKKPKDTTTKSTKWLVIRNATYAHSISRKEVQIVKNATITVNLETGIIQSIKTQQNLKTSLPPVNRPNTKVITLGQNQLIIPGFIDCHAHAPQFEMIGKGLDLPLLQWLNKYTFKCEAKFACNEHAKRVYTQSVKAHLSHGTTTICYFGSIHLQATQILADCMATAGMRGFVGKTCMDCNSPDYYKDVSTKTAIEDTKALINYIKKSGYQLVRPVITPRFAPTCSMELMTGLGKVAKASKSLIQTHLSENKDEIKWVSELFPESTSYTDVYDRSGLLNDKTVLAHCVYLSEKQLALIAQKGAGIAHCPNSNITLQSGIMPTREYLDYSKGLLKIGLGTDVSGGYSLSILDSMKQCIGLSKLAPTSPVTLPQAFWLATKGGAQVLSLQDSIGSFNEGMQFDALLIDYSPENMLHPCYIAPHSCHSDLEEFQKIVYCIDDRNIQKIWVSGKEVISKAFSVNGPL